MEQLDGLPESTTHIVLSSGGNDALIAKDQLFPRSGQNSRNGLELLSQFQVSFRKDYSALLNALKRLNRPITVCTIYDAIPGLESIQKTALSTFNDVILLEAARRGFSVIDLRLLCDEATDYSTVSPIEPSEQGGLKIARAISGIVEKLPK